MSYEFNRVGDFTVGDRVTVSTSSEARLSGVISQFFPLGYSDYFAAAVILDVGGEARVFVHDLLKEVHPEKCNCEYCQHREG